MAKVAKRAKGPKGVGQMGGGNFEGFLADFRRVGEIGLGRGRNYCLVNKLVQYNECGS